MSNDHDNFIEQIAEIQKQASIERARKAEAERLSREIDIPSVVSKLAKQPAEEHGFAQDNRSTAETAEVQTQAGIDREIARQEAARRAAAEQRDTELRDAERRAEIERRAEAERREAERRSGEERRIEEELRLEAERREAQRRAEEERRSGIDRRDDAEPWVEAQRQAETELRDAELREAERLVEAERLAEAERRAEAERLMKAERLLDLQQQANIERARLAREEERRQAEEAFRAELNQEADIPALITTLTEQRETVTDPEEYDWITTQIAEAEKHVSIARARQVKAESLARAEQRRQAVETYRAGQAEIERLYGEMGKLDEVTFKAVSVLFKVIHARFEHWETIVNLLDSTQVHAKTHGLPVPEAKPAALFGGSPLRDSESALMRVWLERYSDSFKQAGYQDVTRDSFITSTPAQSSTGKDDILRLGEDF